MIERWMSDDLQRQEGVIDSARGHWRWGDAVRILMGPPPGNPLGSGPAVVQMPPHGTTHCIAALYAEGELVPVFAGDNWVFNRYEQEQPKVSSTYDAAAFERHVDMAIAQIREQLIEQREGQDIQPDIRSNSTAPEAMLKTAQAMMLRSMTMPTFESMLSSLLESTKTTLLSKNKSYGNSALDPVRIFSKASIKEQLLVRIDDKISRIVRGQNAGEDVAGDLMGYFVLLTIAEIREEEKPGT